MPNANLKIVISGFMAATAYLVLQCPCSTLLSCENKLFLSLWAAVLLLVEGVGQQFAILQPATAK